MLDQALPRLRVDPARGGDPASFFDAPPALLGLEIGFGGGEHAASLAAGDPTLGLIACEVFEPGLCSMLSRLVPDTADPATAPLPGNLRLWDDDARILMRALRPSCLDLVALMFPDPWPKARHAKRRFVHPAQVALVAGLLKPGGVWRVASDDPTYQDWTRDTMANQVLFAPAEPQTKRPAGWPATRYEAKALRAGRRPLYWSFTRTTAEAAAPEVGWSRTEPPP